MNISKAQSNQPRAPQFNYDVHVKELTERFNRLVKQLGPTNTSKTVAGKYAEGTDRYKFEVDFSYALHDLQMSPSYLQGKMFDKASGIVSNLINHLKQLKETEVKEPENA